MVVNVIVIMDLLNYNHFLLFLTHQGHLTLCQGQKLKNQKNMFMSIIHILNG